MKPIEYDASCRIGTNWMLNLALGGGGFTRPYLDSLATIIIRMVDLATDEYEISRHFLLQHGTRVGSGTLLTLPAACDHLEVCVSSMRRALRCWDRIRSSRELPSIDRTVRRQLSSVAQGIVDIRNTIEHIDEQISKGLKIGEGHTLRLSDDGKVASINGRRISTEDIHQAMTLLRKIAVQLSQHRSPVAES